MYHIMDGASHVSFIKAYSIITATNAKAMVYNLWRKRPQIEYKLVVAQAEAYRRRLSIKADRWAIPRRGTRD